jgi:hypothetical protein
MEPMKTPLTLEHQAEGWWLEASTMEPDLYLFGPFDTSIEVMEKTDRYLVDLSVEGRQVSTTCVVQRGPLCLLEGEWF